MDGKLNKTCYTKCPYKITLAPNQCSKDINPELCEKAILSEDGRRKSIEYYSKILRSPACYCGKYKKPKMAVCHTCWTLLPHDLAHALYRPIRGGAFGEAYEIARDCLRETYGKG